MNFGIDELLRKPLADKRSAVLRNLVERCVDHQEKADRELTS